MRGLVLYGLATALLVSCGQPNVGETPGDEVTPVAWVNLPPGAEGTASDAATAVKGADLVIVGTVVDSHLGRTVGPAGEPGVSFIETAIEVTEVLAAARGFGTVDKGGVGSVVLVETETIDGREQEAGPGSQVVALLWLKRDEESGGRFLRPITRGALLVLDKAGQVSQRATVLDDPVGAELEELGLSGIRKLVGG